MDATKNGGLSHLGDPLETKLLLKGRIGERLLFLDEDADTVKLIEYRVARRTTP